MPDIVRPSIPSELWEELKPLVENYRKHGCTRSQRVLAAYEENNCENPLLHISRPALAELCLRLLGGMDITNAVAVIIDEVDRHAIMDSLERDAVKEILK